MTVLSKAGMLEVKRLLIYVASAVVMGILVTVIPLITFAEVKHESFVPTSPWLNKNIRGLEGYSNLGTLGTPNSDSFGFTILIVSFVVSMVVYLFVRHRVPRHDLPWARFPVY
jgi:hypothetical protein